MSEADVSLIQDEDVLRRMWQQTEDFSRRKEIRAHMYRLREERLRNLYSPEPTIVAKGTEFSSRQGHVKSFADQTFQSMKSKEVRDAGSPPKEFTYRGQDLKEMSNAGWNVESENKTTDDGHTHIRTVQANIEGKYDVEGGQGKFAAVDLHKQAATEYHDDNTSIKRNESASKSAAHEEVFRKTDDGTQISSNTSSSTSSSKVQQSSSSTYESGNKLSDSQCHQITRDDAPVQRVTKIEEKVRTTDISEGELVSRKVEYPDNDTKVITETRCLPDGTRVTSTRREIKTPIVKTSHSEHHAKESRQESRFSSTQQSSNIKETSSKVIRESSDSKTRDVRNEEVHDAASTVTSRSEKNIVTNKTNDSKDDVSEYNSSNKENIKSTKYVDDNKRSTQTKTDDIIEKKVTNDQYQTTYQSDYQKKISTDLSHQAWASTLRGDTPTSTRPSTRASSPGSKTFMSSTSSIRSSVSPDKRYGKPPSRGGSPNKYDRHSPSRSSKYSTTSSTTSTMESKTRDYYSPERQNKSPTRRTYSPNKKQETSYPNHNKRPEESIPDSKSPTHDAEGYPKSPSNATSHSPDRKPPTGYNPARASSFSPDRKPLSPVRASKSPDKIPGYMRPTAASQHLSHADRKSPSQSPDRKPGYVNSRYEKIQEDHQRFVNEEIKTHRRDDTDVEYVRRSISPSPARSVSPSGTFTRDSPDFCRSGTPRLTPTLKDSRRSPSPPKGPVTFSDEKFKHEEHTSSTSNSKKTTNEKLTSNERIETITRKSPIRESSPTKYHTYDKKQNKTVTEEVRTPSREKTPIYKHTDTPRPQKPREYVSPAKSLSKDKYKHSSEFISTEKTFEEVNKTTKGHPRQLVTPSSSPTRKPKMTEQPSSTGQSSPTTSVSEFDYFSAPQQTHTEDISIDTTTEYYSKTGSNEVKHDSSVRPNSLNIKRSPSPSKIPCRSPSPEKKLSPTKENLPIKSALKKKPSTDHMLGSPNEKPPTTFCASPTEELIEITEHKVVKKDNPEKSYDDVPSKVKPPLERRETYEERCKKILGMMDDDEKTKKTFKDSVNTFIDNERKETTKHIVKTNNPSRDSSPTKLQDITSVKKTTTKFTTEKFIKNEDDIFTSNKLNKTVRKSTSPEKTPTPARASSPRKVLESPKHSRTPSPTKQTILTTNTEFIATEREKEVLDRVNQSLRKLSPNRKDKSPSREKSPTLFEKPIPSDNKDKFMKETIDIEETITDDKESHRETKDIHKEKSHPKPSKLPSRTNSPTKKPSQLPETPTKFKPSSRLPSPQNERPSSPQVPKVTGTKLKEHANVTRIASPIKTLTVDGKKSSSITNKQTKTTNVTNIAKNSQVTNNVSETTNKKREEIKNKVNTNLNKGNANDSNKFTRTSSETTIKNKKPAPQRVKSKPEIHVNDVSNKTKQTTVKLDINKANKESNKLSSKPKSATSLNTHEDENEILIDVEQAKSSRENSPDRICPTPVFMEELGTPRLPDEVSEPDDDFMKRTHDIIHETDSVIDDIIELTDDEEIMNVDRITLSDECLLSVTDKVTKFTNKVDDITKSAEYIKDFKDVEKREHSDFIDKNTESNVSEKVSKFTDGIQDSKIDKTKTNIKDEYDTETVYQDDYTKLSVNDKATMFIETAENTTVPKPKPVLKQERPDLTNVDEKIKGDNCLLSVNEKVSKFLKTTNEFLEETREEEENEKRVKEQYDKILNIMKNIDSYKDDFNIQETIDVTPKKPTVPTEKLGTFAKETASSQAKTVDHPSTNLKTTEKTPPLKITTLRSSEAVKKAKALFENIATTQKETTKSTKLTDIGVIKKSPITDSTTVLHPSVENVNNVDTLSSQTNSRPTSATSNLTRERTSPSRSYTQSPTIQRKPSTPTFTQTETTKTVLSRYPVATKPEPELTPEKTPHYQLPTVTSQLHENKVEEYEVSTRRGSGKFGVELRRTSLERSTLSSERRRSSEHPCIEDIFDLDLLEQMLEKVSGYEQRRRIRAQIRIVKKKIETEQLTSSYTKTTSKQTVTKTKSPERKPSTPKQKSPTEHHETKMNGHEYKITVEKRQRTRSPEKLKSPRSPVRQSSPEKRTRTQSPNKVPNTQKSKPNRFNEYASAYMRRISSEDETVKIIDTRNKSEEKQTETHHKTSSTTFSERKSSKEFIETKETKINGERNISPKSTSPERKQKTQRLYQRSPSPDFKRKTEQKETIIKTVIEPKTPQSEKPSWITNRNLKKVSNESRSFLTKKVESEKKYRTPSPSKVISKPLDVITSSYGIGPLDSDGKPLFGIKALRNGASNYQVKGTVIRQDYHSHNGSAPEGTVSVTAYSTNPEELEMLLRTQGEKPSRIHGLAAITTTKKFGGGTGNSIQDVQTKEERATLDQFTHHDRRLSSETLKTESTRSNEKYSGRWEKEDKGRIEKNGREERIEGEKKTVRQNSVKSLTEKFIKNASETSKSERSSSYPKAGLILRTTHATNGHDTSDINRSDSHHSLNSTEDNISEIKSSSTIETTPNSYKQTRTTITTKSTKSGHGNGDIKSNRTESHATKSNRMENQTAKSNRTENQTKSNRTENQTKSNKMENQTAKSNRTENQTKSNRTENQTTKSNRMESQTTKSTVREVKGEKSFLDSNTKVTGVKDILTRMKNADIVIEDGDSSEDAEARALLNKFLGATVLMAGMKDYVDPRAHHQADQRHVGLPTAAVRRRLGQESRSVTRTVGKLQTSTSEEFDPDLCWDERILRKTLEESSDYEQRRRLRIRLRNLMAEQEACATAVTEALTGGDAAENAPDSREEEEVTTVTSSVRRNSTEQASTTTTTTSTKSSKVIETRAAPKPASPFAKFRQLEKQNSLNSPNSPKTPQSPSSPSQPYFKFTDPALQASAVTIKERLLQWCRDKTRDYENVKLENFSTSWADGLAFCALVHHFLPEAFDYSTLTPEKRRHNFTLAFKIADEKAGIYPLLDVDDMVAMRKPDWKCVFTYVQSIHRRFKDQN